MQHGSQPVKPRGRTEERQDDAEHGALEDMVVNECGEGREADAIDAWLEEYPDAFDTVVTD